jgi:hypothetical protein
MGHRQPCTTEPEPFPNACVRRAALVSRRTDVRDVRGGRGSAPRRTDRLVELRSQPEGTLEFQDADRMPLLKAETFVSGTAGAGTGADNEHGRGM